MTAKYGGYASALEQKLLEPRDTRGDQEALDDFILSVLEEEDLDD